MGEILKGYNLGEFGVNVAKSPIHITDGELVQAQNVEFYREQGRGALRKRPGLQRFNGSGMGGSVAGFIGVPLPGLNEKLFLVNLQDSTNNGPTWGYSTDLGASWTIFVTSLGASSGLGAQLDKSDQSSTIDNYINPVVVFENTVFYASFEALVGSIPGRLLAFRRASDAPGSGAVRGVFAQFIRFGSAAGIDGIFRYKADLYVLVRGDGGLSNFCYKVNPETAANEILGLGSTFTPGTENLFCGAGYLGDIFVGTSRATQGRIHRIRQGDESWTLERTAAANLHTYSSLAVFEGTLFAATSALAGTAALIEARTPGGVWSTSRTGSHSTQANYFDGLFVHAGELFAFYQTRGATTICEIHKFDGSSWSVDEDLNALTGNPDQIWGVTEFNGRLLVALSNTSTGNFYVASRSSAGVWTISAALAGSPNSSWMAVL